MVIRRNLDPFGVDLCWDGKTVFVDNRDGSELIEVERTIGPRTALEIMEEVEDNLHDLCNAMR